MDVNIHTVNASVKPHRGRATLAGVGSVEDAVRRKITAWMAARGVTKTALGSAAGRNQSWATRYLDGEFSTDLDTLQRVAAFFGEPLAALFEQTPDDDLREVLFRYRATTPPRRALVLELLREWTPDSLVKQERGGRPRQTRGRSGARDDGP